MRKAPESRSDDVFFFFPTTFKQRTFIPLILSALVTLLLSLSLSLSRLQFFSIDADFLPLVLSWNIFTRHVQFHVLFRAPVDYQGNDSRRELNSRTRVSSPPELVLQLFLPTSCSPCDIFPAANLRGNLRDFVER